MEDKKVWNIIKNGKIIKVTFPDEVPGSVVPQHTKVFVDEAPEKELDWFRLYQPEGANENKN